MADSGPTPPGVGAMIGIEQEKCSGCGLCVQVCPHRLLRLEAQRVAIGEGECMACGHCRAVCPTGAVGADDLPVYLGLHRISETPEALQPGECDPAALVRLMHSRRSCRNYVDRPVPLELLEDLVRVGTTAPSGTNSQGWNFVILPQRADVEVLGGLTADFFRRLNDRAKNPLYRLLARITAGDALGRYYRNHYASVQQALREWDEMRIDRLFHGATAAILVTCKRTASCAGEDALLATQNILLAAHALGLGSCLIGYVVEAMRRSGTIRRLMAIPSDEELYSVIALGYPAIRYRLVAGRRMVRPRVLHLAPATGGLSMGGQTRDKKQQQVNDGAAG